jgi:uncharacterized damage-inducible protein DinB
MSIGESLLPEFDQELRGTRRVLQNVTDEILDWKAHQKSNTVRWVASHLADIPSWADVCINKDSFDVAPPGEPPHRTEPLDDVDSILKKFDENVARAREVIAEADDGQFLKEWSLLKGGEVMMTMPRIAVVRSFIFNHMIHHRGHLCVYLRLNELPVPALYGPSSDDSGM